MQTNVVILLVNIYIIFKLNRFETILVKNHTFPIKVTRRGINKYFQKLSSFVLRKSFIQLNIVVSSQDKFIPHSQSSISQSSRSLLPKQKFEFCRILLVAVRSFISSWIFMKLRTHVGFNQANSNMVLKTEFHQLLLVITVYALLLHGFR